MAQSTTQMVQSSELVFRDAICGTVESIKKTFSRVASVEVDMLSLLSAAFADAAKNGEKGTELPMFLDFTDIQPEETWALAHLGYILTRAPGDFRNAKVYAKPAPEFTQFYQVQQHPAGGYSEQVGGGGGASGAK